MNVLIIGATSGIGKALFEIYAAKGNRIGIVGRRVYLLDELYQRHPDNTFTSGRGDLNPSLDYALESPTIETNVRGWTFVIDMFYHVLEKQGHGHLVAITSVGGLRGEPMAPAYSATKAFQINYMEALRKKAFKNGSHIAVTDIRPGLVDTAMAKG